MLFQNKIPAFDKTKYGIDDHRNKIKQNKATTELICTKELA